MRVEFVSEVQTYELMLVLPFIVFTLTILFDLSYVWHALGITTRQALAAEILTLLSSMMVPPWPHAIWALALTPLTFLAPRRAVIRPLKREIATVLQSLMAIFTTFLLESKLDSVYPYERLLGVDFSLWMSLGWAFAAQMLVRKGYEQIMVLGGVYFLFQLSSCLTSGSISYAGIRQFWVALFVILVIQVVRLKSLRLSSADNRWI